MRRLLFCLVWLLCLSAGGNVQAEPVPAPALQVFLPAILSQPSNAQDPQPTLADFSIALNNGQPGTLRGVYSAELLALPVLQQPAGNYAYIAAIPGVATQFGLAQAGVTGLLAHNYLAGGSFFHLTPGNVVYLVYGDGLTQEFVVHAIYRYQVVDPANPSSDLIDLDSGLRLTPAQVFALHYMGDPHVTLQTCIAQNGNPSWGRLFVTAWPSP